MRMSRYLNDRLRFTRHSHLASPYLIALHLARGLDDRAVDIQSRHDNDILPFVLLSLPILLVRIEQRRLAERPALLFLIFHCSLAELQVHEEAVPLETVIVPVLQQAAEPAVRHVGDAGFGPCVLVTIDPLACKEISTGFRRVPAGHKATSSGKRLS